MPKEKKKIVVFTGAGVSAESGINTFRDADGLWEGHDVMSVASPEGWMKNPKLVLDFYNARRAQLKEVSPNFAHKAIAKLEDQYEVVVITQNVDDLHERGGSNHVLHLHGELRKVRSVKNSNLVLQWTENLNLGDYAEDGGQLRPHIVWFGEEVPMLDAAIRITQQADIFIVIGSSMQVYPAAGLVHYAPASAQIYYIDPRPALNHELKMKEVTVIAENAVRGMQLLLDEFLL